MLKINYENYKGLNVTKEDFNNLTIKEINDKLDELKMKEIEAKRVNNDILEDYRFFFTGYDILCDLFGKELTEKYMVLINRNNLVEELPVRRSGYKPSNAKFIKNEIRAMKKLRGAGSRSGATENVYVDVYEIPYKFQGLYHPTVIKAIFDEKYPEFNKFTFEFYEIHNNLSEFYLKTNLKNYLYIPYRAFVDKDIKAILKRNEEYLKWFYNSLDVYNNLLEDEIVKSFLELLK